MRAKALRQRRNELLPLFALCWAGAATLGLLVVADPGPVALLPVGIAALPFAASRRTAPWLRLAAAALLCALAAPLGVQAWLLLVPSILALLASAGRVLVPRPASARRSR